MAPRYPSRSGQDSSRISRASSSEAPNSAASAIAVAIASSVARAGLDLIAGLARDVVQSRVQLARAEPAHARLLADRDREADAQLAADRDDRVSIEATVGPHRQLSARSGSADPADRLTQEVGGPPGGVGTALAQPGHEHVTAPGRNREQRVVAAHAGVAVVPGALLRQAIGLADRRVEVDGEWRCAGSRSGRPGPGRATRGSRGRRLRRRRARSTRRAHRQPPAKLLACPPLTPRTPRQSSDEPSPPSTRPRRGGLALRSRIARPSGSRRC